MEGPAAAPERPVVRAAAFAVSALSSPYVVTAAVVVGVVMLLHPTLPQMLVWGGICVLSGAVVPFLVVLALWRSRKLTDIHVAVREQRDLPFAAALVSGALGVLTLHQVGAPTPLLALGGVYLANGLVLALISRRWKISVHVGVLTAGIVAISLLGYAAALWALLLVPPVLWARLYRGKHTLLQGVAPVTLCAAVTPVVYEAMMVWLGG